MVEVADLSLVSTFTMFQMVECSTTVQLLLLVLLIMTVEVAGLLLVSTFTMSRLTTHSSNPSAAGL